jgi:enamine deaminase RidA (YjgF/YER057c/UK114 family)
LPEVISNFDKRIIKLEENIKNISGQRPLSISEQNVPSNINEVLDEFNLRFEVLAEEISMLKDTILKLQSFTMDVNKVLMNERVRVLSDLGSTLQLTNDEADVNSVFSLASEVINGKNDIGQESPTTSVDMRDEINK